MSPHRKRLLGGIAPVIDLIRLQWWRWARAELTRKNPMHPDLPMVIRRCNEIERSA
jgi:hypothetical protein